jgi:hypothetical protein
MECMSEEDVERLEKEFDQQQTEIEELRVAISHLNKENDQLKEDLRNIVRLAYNMFMYLDRGTLNSISHAVAIRHKILSLFETLHKYQEV